MKRPGHFLKTLSSAARFRRLIPRRKKIKGLRAGLVVLKTGEEVGGHSSENKEEALVILEGTASISCGRRKISARGHSFIYIPPHAHHNVKNIGSGPLKYVYLTAALS